MSFRDAMLHDGAVGVCLGEISAEGAASQIAALFTPTSAPAPGAENRVLLQDAIRATTGLGRVEARPDQLSVEFSSAFPLDLSKASDEITPHAEGEPTFLGDLNIAISGGAFSDLIFSLSMADTDNENGPSLTISAYDGSTEIGSACLTGLRSDQETTFAIVARSAVLTRVELRSSTGIRAARNFQVSGIGSRKRAAGAGHRGAAPHARQPAQSDSRRRESPRLLLCLQRQPGRRAGGRRMKPKT